MTAGQATERIRARIGAIAPALDRRWQRISLRTRLTAIATAAVAVAVIGVSVAAYLVIGSQLHNQFDQRLADQAQSLSHGVLPNQDGPGRDHNPTSGPNSWEQRRDVPLWWYTYDAGAVTATTFGQTAPQPVTAGLRSVLVDGAPGPFYDDVQVGRDRYRMVTIRARIGDHDGALQFARQPVDVEESLAKLTLVLAVIGAIGVVGAALLGRTVARAGLGPVDRLTAAAEHVAATQDLTAAIAVTGDDEVARLARAFNAMLAALDSSRADQRRLVEDASHELRTPLTSLRTNIELLLRAEEHSDSGRAIPAADRARLLHDLSGQMVELTQLTNELVELARNDAGTEPVEELDLADVVGAAVERARIRVPGVPIEATLEPAPVTGRAASLERAVLNVLDNAAKWTPPGAPIRVSLVRRWEAGRPRAVLEVEDRGPGVAEEDRPRIFERFYRAASARAMPGSGLGLAIVQQAVAAHGGAVSVERGAAGGALFRISLPCPARPGPPPPAFTRSAGPAAPAAPGLAGGFSAKS